MKKITYILTLITLAVLLACCDKIEGPYLQYDDSVETTVEFPELDRTSIYKKVLVEEFTGHRCQNCPDGHRLLATLLDTYGDTLVPLCVHAGYFANSNSDFPANFRTEEGTSLYQDFSVGATPRAIFNHSRYNGLYALEMVKWAPAVAYFSQQSPIAAVQMINEFSGGVITTHTKTTFLTDFEEQVKLALYVIEDGIVSPQIDDGDTIVDYVHNHVLRGSMNGTYGTFISDDGRVVADSGYVKSYRLVADGSWVPARCSVVAILMNATEPHEVLQVEKCPFLNE